MIASSLNFRILPEPAVRQKEIVPNRVAQLVQKMSAHPKVCHSLRFFLYVTRLVDLAMISKIAMARSAMVKHRDLRSDGDGLKTIFFLLKTLDTWSFKLCLKHKKRCISNKNLETAEIIRIIGYETLLYYGV